MLDFSSWLDLPLIWSGLIAMAVMLYAILDGFDLGCGILFPFAPSDKCRDRIMNSISPFWDSNETWLVLGGGGLLAAFPLAYSVLIPALYLPIIFMLIGLILRGVAFEFRFKSSKNMRKVWDLSFHIGSVTAALMQGIILGNFIQGTEVEQRSFAGGSLDWANGFSILNGVSMVFVYALLGSTWLIMKTEGETQKWSRWVASYVLIYVFIDMIIVSISLLLIEQRVIDLWFSSPNMFYLFPIPLLTVVGFISLWKNIHSKHEVRPFLFAIMLLILSYLGIIISIYPWIVPFEFTIWEAAATPYSLSLLLIGTAIMLPIILVYVGYSYYVFRGKTSDEKMY